MCFCPLNHLEFAIFFLSNQDVGHKQRGDGGEGQAEAGGGGQAGRGVAQVGVAARLGHGVDGGVGAAGREVHLRGPVALGHSEAALLNDIHDAGCFPNTTVAMLVGFTCGFRS